MRLAAQELMAQARQGEELEPFPDDWAVALEYGSWTARLDPEVPLTAVEVELGYTRRLRAATREDLLRLVRGRDVLRGEP